MSPKFRSFFEDLTIILIVGGIIYGVYFFFFNSEEKNDVIEDKVKVEKSIEIQTKKEPLNTDNIIKAKQLIENNSINNEEIENNAEEKTEIIENTQNDLNTQEEPKTIENIETSEDKENIVLEEETNKEEVIETPTETTEIKPVTIKSFYKEIEEKIYTNISQNINKTTLKDKRYTNIRITILEDGSYEQLTFMSGSKEYFNAIKPSVLNIFPLKIDNSIKYRFPRYFRMKVKF